jgi:hypothetical protein
MAKGQQGPTLNCAENIEFVDHRKQTRCCGV